MRKTVLTSLGLLGIALSIAVAQRGGPAGAPLDASKFTTQTRNYDRKALLNPPPISEEAYRGRVVWLQRCAYCHDGVGQGTYKTIGPWLGKESVDSLGAESFGAFVLAGTDAMPGFQYTLTAAQVNEVMAYLNTVPSSAKPTPNQLAGRAAASANEGE